MNAHDMIRSWDTGNRLGGLRRSASFATMFTVLGHVWLGFEQSQLQLVVCLLTAYSMEFAIELADAWAGGRKPCFVGGWRKVVDFLLASHMTGLSISMLLYANNRLAVMAFATAVAIGQKRIFRVQVNGRSRHFLNPSNIAIATCLLLFPWVGNIPYEFTAGVTGPADVIVPLVIVVAGTLLNAQFTGRLPLIISWVLAFAAQAVIRALLFDTAILAGLMPMTGTAFILYTFYMMTDPATTPSTARGQLFFAGVTAAAYGVLMALHVPFALFFGLASINVLRGLGLTVGNLYSRLLQPAAEPVLAPALSTKE